MRVFIGLPVDCVWNSGSDLQAGVEIYHWGYFGFRSFWVTKMTPFWDPKFPPPVWSIGGPISPCPQKARTQFQIVHLDMSPRSCLLSCGSWGLPWLGGQPVGTTPILVDLASLPQVANPWRPDAGASEGTRFGERSRNFLLEGHRVSCLVPTSGRSAQGVNFGVFRANIRLG